jgi:hypothetical protein
VNLTEVVPAFASTMATDEISTPVPRERWQDRDVIVVHDVVVQAEEPRSNVVVASVTPKLDPRTVIEIEADAGALYNEAEEIVGAS